MININTVCQNVRHKGNFEICRPDGSGDDLLVIFKPSAVLIQNGEEITVSPDSLILYSKGTMQHYKTLCGSYVNHFVHFDTDDTDGRTPTYAYKNEKETDADQAAFTKDFIKQIVDIQKNRNKIISPKGITGITVWGISDQTSWRGSCKPLFFTRKNVRVKDETTGKYKTVYTYVPKKSYEAMIEALK